MAIPSIAVQTLPYLQLAIIVALIFVAGTAWCFNLWILPIIKLNSSISAVYQFEETSSRGGRWLEPFNTFLAATLAVTSLLVYHHPDPVEAGTWKYYAAASATLVQVAWWERLLIFPIDRVAAEIRSIPSGSKGLNQDWLYDESQIELHSLMDRWQWYHAVRASLPFIAAMVALSAKLKSCH